MIHLFLMLTTLFFLSTGESATINQKDMVDTASGYGGSGGGDTCQKPKGPCYSLAELGYRVGDTDAKENINQWLPSSGLMESLDEIDAQMPFGSMSLKAFALNYFDYSIFENVESVSEERYQQAFSEYKSVFFNTPSLDFEQLSFSAISNYYKTFLLPQFYSLKPRQQALKLIHEAYIRRFINYDQALKFEQTGLSNDLLQLSDSGLFGNKISLKTPDLNPIGKAIRFDGVLLDYLSDKDTTTYDYTLFLEEVFLSNGHSNMQGYFSELFKHLRLLIGEEITLHDLSDVDPLNFDVSKMRGLDVNYEVREAKLGQTFIELEGSTRFLGPSSLIRGDEVFKQSGQSFSFIFENTRQTYHYGSLSKDSELMPLLKLSDDSSIEKAESFCSRYSSYSDTRRYVVMDTEKRFVTQEVAKQTKNRGQFFVVDCSSSPFVGFYIQLQKLKATKKESLNVTVP